MNKIKSVITYLPIFPAVFIGTLAMISYGVTSSIWIQNLLVLLLGSILGTIYLIRNRKKWSNGNLLYVILLISLLVLPFWFDGFNGVHRWLTLGPINIYISSIVLPILIIFIWSLALNNRLGYATGLIFTILLILLFHPDAGQLTAFAFATAIIVWKKIRTGMRRLLSIALMGGFVILSWIYLDDLAPVPYVEDIILIVADLGAIWLILGILSLILVLSPFFYYGNKNIVSLSLGVYFLMTMIVTLFGNFPLPIMGYGISPIIGYLIAITWVKKDKYRS